VESPSGRSVLAVGESLEHLHSYCDAASGVIITDGTVRGLHGNRLPSWTVIEIGVGEESKTLKTVHEVYEEFLRLEVDRSSFVLGVGGGIVCDVAGFAASTYLRGLRFGFVPTTVLAQVDASVGGKNGVNLRGYKNLVGTFSQPVFVLCNMELLKTLPLVEIRNGFAEVIKQAAIGDGELFAFLEQTRQKALSLEPEAMERIVHDSLNVKSGIVSQDEKEAGERRKLNFGHTLGHALEKAYKVRHGEAVSVGMAAAARLSVARGLLPENDLRRLEDLLIDYGLPVKMQIEGNLVLDGLRKDKKREDETIRFVLLDAIGSAKIVPIRISELEGVIVDLCKSR
jgi:3-dehydroquinate synthase